MDHATFGYALIVLGVLVSIGLPLIYLRPAPTMARNVSPVARRLSAIENLGAGIACITFGLILINGKLDTLIIIGYLISMPALLIGVGGLVLLSVRRAMRASRDA